jgi:flagellar hook-length control protein FliK
VVAPPPQAFTEQIARPIFALASAGNGDHTMTISVTPDNLGPVIVRAQVSSDGIRVELFAPNDAGREALRSILPDLRRDLAGGGLNSNLSLSSDGRPAGNGAGPGTTTGDGTPGDTRGWTRGDQPDNRATGSDRRRLIAAEPVPAPTTGPTIHTASAIDVMV